MRVLLITAPNNLCHKSRYSNVYLHRYEPVLLYLIKGVSLTRVPPSLFVGSLRGVSAGSWRRGRSARAACARLICWACGLLHRMSAPGNIVLLMRPLHGFVIDVDELVCEFHQPKLHIYDELRYNNVYDLRR
jgi:hypothetical protein